MRSKINQPSVAVIGAGCSGIAAVKNLAEAGLTNIICFEKSDQIGGNWVFSSQNGHSSVCETTHIISSKKLSEFSDFPMPDHYPDYPSHEQVLAYFQGYARHFGLERFIRFNTEVKRAEQSGDGWRLTLGNGEIQQFDFLLVANGHHSVPRHPALPGTFSGEYLHSHNYKTNRPFTGKKVLVIGAGNSGCDCAVEISRVAEKTVISVRSGQYIIPKFFMGKPVDAINETMSWVPEVIAKPLRKLTIRLQVGKYGDYGLPEPDHGVTEAHPTVNSELLYKIRHGKVHPRPDVESVDGNEITFSNQITESYDTIVAATGYKIALPFFDPDFINYENADRIELYLRMFHPDHTNLMFIGLVQPQGAIWPLSDAQSKLSAAYILGKWRLPGDLKRRAVAEADQIAKKFKPGKRHTVEVHFHRYLKELEKEIKKAGLQMQTG